MVLCTYRNIWRVRREYDPSSTQCTSTYAQTIPLCLTLSIDIISCVCIYIYIYIFEYECSVHMCTYIHICVLIYVYINRYMYPQIYMYMFYSSVGCPYNAQSYSVSRTVSQNIWMNILIIYYLDIHCLGILKPKSQQQGAWVGVCVCENCICRCRLCRAGAGGRQLLWVSCLLLLRCQYACWQFVAVCGAQKSSSKAPIVCESVHACMHECMHACAAAGPAANLLLAFIASIAVQLYLLSAVTAAHSPLVLPLPIVGLVWCVLVLGFRV